MSRQLTHHSYSSSYYPFFCILLFIMICCHRLLVLLPDSCAILCFLGESFFMRLRFLSLSFSSSGSEIMVRNYIKKSLHEHSGGFISKV